MANRLKKVRALVKKRDRIDTRLKKLNETRKEIDEELHSIVTSKKGRDTMFVDDNKIAVITSSTRIWDLDAIRKIIHTPKVKKRALATGIIDDDVDSALLENAVIQTVESVRVEVIERMLKHRVINAKQAQKMYTLKENKPYVRVDKVNESD